MADSKSINISDKYMMTIDETAQYTNIGTKKIRELCHDSQCDFILRVGTKILINRKKFEQFLDSHYVL